MTRLPVAPGDHRYRPRVDESIAVKANGETEPECRVVITEIRRETLGDITFADVKAEGFHTSHDFYAAFRCTHGLALPPTTVDLLERLELAATAGHGDGQEPAHNPGVVPAAALHPGLSPRRLGTRLHQAERQQLVSRDGRRWFLTERGVHRLHDPLDGIDLRDEVWAITFEVDRREVPRYLAPASSPAGAPRAGDDEHASLTPAARGYTEQAALALVDPGPGKKDLPVEAVDDAAQARITERAGMTAEQWRALEQAQRDQELEELSLGQQLDRLIADAKREGRPVSKDVRVIERRIKALQRGHKAA